MSITICSSDQGFITLLIYLESLKVFTNLLLDGLIWNFVKN